MFRKLILGVSFVLFVLGISVEAKEKITYWAWAEHIEVAKALESDFEAMYPDIDVEPVALGAWDLHDKLLISLVSGVGAPDVALIVTRRAPAFVGTGGLLNLTKWAKEYESRMDPATWAAVAKNGEVYGMPYDRHPAVLFYRADLFEQYGIDAPIETWDELVDAGMRMRSAGGPFMLWQMYPGGKWGASHFLMFFHSRGCNIYDATGSVIEHNDCGYSLLDWWYKAAFEYQISLLADHHTPDFWAAVSNDQLATFPIPLWGLARLKKEVPEQAGKWRAMPWPKWEPDSPPYTGVWGGNVLVIPKQTKHPEAAWRWVEFLSTTLKGQLTAWEIGGSVPAYLPALNDPALDRPVDYLGGQSLLPVLAARQIPPINYFDWARTEEVIGYAIEACFSGKKSPAQAWEDAEAELAK